MKAVRMRPAVWIGSLIIAVALTGCGSFDAQLTAPGGTGGGVRGLEIRDARFSASPPRAGDEAYAAGEDAPLTLTIVNAGDATDRLESVSSPVAGGSRITGDTQILDGSALVSGDGRGAPAQTSPATVRADVVLTDLRAPVRAGLTYPVTFTFARAGSVTVATPVGNPDA